jgi:hypothetical protein
MVGKLLKARILVTVLDFSYSHVFLKKIESKLQAKLHVLFGEREREIGIEIRGV